MAGRIWELFGFRAEDESEAAQQAADNRHCPVINAPCEKRFSDGVISGVCSLKPVNSQAVICCPIRLYGDSYMILSQVASMAFGGGLQLVPGREAVAHSKSNVSACVAVFGKRWGGELRLPQKGGKGGYFVDWVLAKIDSSGALEEFVAVEVQTIDTTGSYRAGYDSLMKDRANVSTTAGLNWENVSKRILPQLIYKGQVLQREDLCRKGLFFVCPDPVLTRIMARLGGQDGLVKYALQPASITFLAYTHGVPPYVDGALVPLVQTVAHSTTVYKLQEAFNNVTLPDENVYKAAILRALGA